MGKTDKLIQSRNQQASTKSFKMTPFLFFTLLIVATSGFEVNQKAAAGYENRRSANLSKKLIPANLREKLIQANLRESLFSGLSPSSVNLREKLIRDKLPKPLPSKPVLTKGYLYQDACITNYLGFWVTYQFTQCGGCVGTYNGDTAPNSATCTGKGSCQVNPIAANYLNTTDGVRYPCESYDQNCGYHGHYDIVKTPYYENPDGDKKRCKVVYQQD